MSKKDSRGLATSTSDAAALECYERAAMLTHGYFGNPIAVIDEALAAQPDFALGHCLKAAIAVMSSERAALPMLRDSVEAIERLGSGATDRERAHAAAGRAWLEGDFARSVRLYGEIALEHPLDLLALQTAHVGDFYLGESTMLRDRIAQALPCWSPEVPGFGFVLGMYAFGLEETALYSRAEDAGRRALDLNPRDPWAVHAVAHVLEMQGRIREGIDWLNSTSGDWAGDCGFAYHNWWHLALHHLELDEHERALELYDQAIHPRSTQVALELVDASALLWRLALRGVDVGDRWKQVADDWSQTAEGGFYAFNDVHGVMAYAATGRDADVARVVDVLARRAGESDTNGTMSRDVGLPLARAIAALSQGDAAAAVECIVPMRTRAHRFGGSHAQRDIVHLTLLEAAHRAGRVRLERALASERTELKPTSPFNWKLTARALEAAGEAQAARTTLEHAAVRRRAQQRSAAA
jgi:tetratricopeptide (TPR) repeat protein